VSSRGKEKVAIRPATAHDNDDNTKSVIDLQNRHKISFGAVYEHKDCFGKARLLGCTGETPEHQFMLDYINSKQVKALGRASELQSELVWAGMGSGFLGEAEMGQVRRAVMEKRSKRLQIDKLGSIKPYSRHT